VIGRRGHSDDLASCPRFREAISARLDGEDPGMADEVIDGHLLRCADCAGFADLIAAQHRRSRIRAAASVPDLTGEILLKLSAVTAPPPSRPVTRRLGSLRAPRRRPVGSVPAAGAGRRVGLVPAARRRKVAAGAAAVAVVGAGFAGGGIIAGHLGGSGASGAGPDATLRTVAGASQTNSRYPGATVVAPGVPKPAVELTDTQGQPYDLAQATAGKVTLVYFGYTHCPDLCPINMALTAAALRDLPAADLRKIVVAFITTDPARDTPVVIRTWLDRFDSSFVGLTGTVAAVHAAEEQVQMPLSYPVTSPAAISETGQDYRVVHAGYTLVYAQNGRADLTIDDAARPDQYAVTLEHLLAYGYQEAR
jgi:protein SCO1